MDCSLSRTLKLKAICQEINKKNISQIQIKNNYKIKEKKIYKKKNNKEKINCSLNGLLIIIFI